MKHTHLIVLCTLLVCPFLAFAESPKREFRAAWLAAVGVDWPDKKVSSGTSSQIKAQKDELIGYLDNLKANNMNAVCYHVRPMADAFYASDLAPWSHYLTGTRGKYPGYDPLAFAVEEAHKRGLEIHAWVNPFRHMASGISSVSGASSDPIKKNHADWLLTYSTSSYNGTILDPGNPEVRAHIVAVVKEIITKYDVDGIIFDDYFYPYGGTKNEDAASQKNKPSGMSLADWRRNNIDQTIKGVYDMIQATEPWVRFGVSPFGIYSMDNSAHSKYGVSMPSGITGLDAYNQIYCNTLEWMKGGYVDYVSPQLYWATSDTKQAYGTLAAWWSNVAKQFSDASSKKVHFFASQRTGKSSSGEARLSNSELSKQVGLNRSTNKQSAPGSILFSYDECFDSQGLAKYLKKEQFTQPSLPPAVDWKSSTTLAAPTGLSLSGSTLSWSHSSATRFTVYAYTKGTDSNTALASSSNLVGVVYGKSIDLSSVSDYASKTLAVCAYDRYGNEHAAGFYNLPAQSASLRTSVSSITLTAQAGQTTKPSQTFTVSAENLTQDITVVSSHPGTFPVETLSGWNVRTGGTVRVTLDPSKSAGTYDGYIAVVSGDARIEVKVNATITEVPVEDELTLTPLWKKTTSDVTYITSSGNDNRTIAYYDNKLYLPNYNTKAFSIINANTGALESTKTMDLTSGYYAFCARMTTDGQLLVGNNVANTGTITIHTVDRATGETEALSTSAAIGRVDYFGVYGKWSESGYIVAASTTGNVAYIPFANGKIQTSGIKTLTGKTPAQDASKVVPIDATSFYLNTKNSIPVAYSLSTGAELDAFGEVKPKTSTASGLDVFHIGKRAYMITPIDRLGAFDIFDITNGLASAELVISSTTTLGENANGAVTVDFTTHVVGNNAYIYVLAPNNGVAAYKFTLTSGTTAVETAVEDDVQLLPTAAGVQIRFAGMQQVSIYSANGTLLYRAAQHDGVELALDKGMYIIQVGNTVQKFMR